MLTDDQIATVRDEVGSTPDDETIQTTYARVGTLGGTIYSILSRRLADMRANPAQFAVPGDYSQSTSANIASLEKSLGRWADYAPAAEPDGEVAAFGTIQLRSRHGR